MTLALIFLLMSKDITGWTMSQCRASSSGWDFTQDDFPFEAADFLANHNEIQGNVLNTSRPKGTS